MLHTHRLQLTINSFNAPTIQAQVVVIGPSVRRHVATAHRHKTNASRRENRVGVRVRDVAFVAKDASPFGQNEGQFMDRRQILLGSRQQVKTDWNTVWGTNQVQAPTEELFLLGRAVAAKGFATHLLATRSPRSFAHRQGQ